MAAPLKGVKIVPYHQDWTYFANRFGLQIIGSIELKPGIEPTPNHLVALTQRMQQEKAQVIIYGPQSDRFPRQLASQTGAVVVRLQRKPPADRLKRIPTSSSSTITSEAC